MKSLLCEGSNRSRYASASPRRPIRRSLFTALTLAFAGSLGALSGATAEIPAAIYTDPTPDAAHPARMQVLHIPSHGETINGIAYVAAGAGEHPAVVLLHGLPGNEKNLDLAQAIRRAGWTVVTFNYRGSWAVLGRSASSRPWRTPTLCWLICAIPPMQRPSAWTLDAW